MISSKKKRIVVLCSMIAAICFVMGTTTYAWFTENNRAAADGIRLSTDTTGELNVEIAVENGVRMEMSQVDENGAVIDMGLTKLANIEANKLGPGAFGAVHFYITSEATSFDNFMISVIPNFTVVGGDANKVISLAKEHIKFYSEKTNESYSGEIPYKEADGEMVGYLGNLNKEGETEIILYWYWPYEYADVPDKTSISAKDSRDYDLQDTMIGNYIDSIGFTFEVEGKMNGN